MAQNQKIKNTAIFVISIYFCLSALMTVEAGKHLLKHHRSSAHQGKNRVSYTCNWMCGALTPLQSIEPSLDQTRLPFAGKASDIVPSVLGYYFTPDQHGRAPPHLTSY